MPILHIFRHAKSSWADPGMRDFDRPLASRGIKAAPKMGEYMRANGIAPDFILCSTSRRTRETLGHILPHLDGEARILMEDGLYQAHDAHAVLERLRRLPAAIRRAMVIGHNPVMHDLALMLCQTAARPEDLSALHMKYPTAALATIDVRSTSWATLKQGVGHLTDFTLPRALSLEIQA